MVDFIQGTASGFLRDLEVFVEHLIAADAKSQTGFGTGSYFCVPLIGDGLLGLRIADELDF